MHRGRSMVSPAAIRVTRIHICPITISLVENNYQQEYLFIIIE